MTTRVIRNGDDWTRFLAFIASMPHPFTISVAREEKRTSQMNRLLHRWFADIARETGASDAEVKAECNLAYGVPIKRRDSEEWSAAFGYIFEQLNYPSMCKAFRVFDIPVTRDMTIKQLCEYMDQMERDYRERGVYLTDPEQLRAAA